MKQQIQKLMTRIDARSLRERVIIFALGALVVITLVDQMLLDPLFREQQALTRQLSQDQAKMTEIRAQIQQKMRIQAVDPDQENRERLKELSDRLNRMQAELSTLQRGLVSPDKMSEVLDSLLKRNGRLRLVSLKTLPSASLVDEAEVADKAEKAEKAAADAAKLAAAANAGTAPGADTKNKPAQDAGVAPVYKHGVELTVQGSYSDMVNYMSSLESLPWQLFWGRAKLDSTDYAKATLTLTLYTLSLDKKWLNI